MWLMLKWSVLGLLGLIFVVGVFVGYSWLIIIPVVVYGAVSAMIRGQYGTNPNPPRPVYVERTETPKDFRSSIN